MKISSVININGLSKGVEYEVIAYLSGNRPSYLIQNDQDEFIWLNKQYCKDHILQIDYLYREKIDDYSYYLIPEWLKVENRVLESGRPWKIFGVELYEQFYSHKMFSEHKYPINPKVWQKLHSNDFLMEIIRTQVEAYSKLARVLSDGYNPTVLKAKLIKSDSLQVEDVINLMYNRKLDLDNDFYFSEVTNTIAELDHLFNWSNNHLKSFVKTNHYLDNYNMSEISEMQGIIKENLCVFNIVNEFKYYKYSQFPDSGDGKRMLIFKGKDAIIVFEVDNVIH